MKLAQVCLENASPHLIKYSIGKLFKHETIFFSSFFFQLCKQTKTSAIRKKIRDDHQIFRPRTCCSNGSRRSWMRERRPRRLCLDATEWSLAISSSTSSRTVNSSPSSPTNSRYNPDETAIVLFLERHPALSSILFRMRMTTMGPLHFFHDHKNIAICDERAGEINATQPEQFLT